MAWKLTSYHLEGLTTEECLWRPAREGLHVHQKPDGTWQTDWPTHEGYDLGPPSIEWLTWHLAVWWSMVLDHSLGEGTLAREDATWPGSAEDVRHRVVQLKDQWQEFLDRMTADDLRSPARTRWPFQECPLSDVDAWAKVELAKNAAKVGYAFPLRREHTMTRCSRYEGKTQSTDWFLPMRSGSGGCGSYLDRATRASATSDA